MTHMHQRPTEGGGFGTLERLGGAATARPRVSRVPTPFTTLGDGGVTPVNDVLGSFVVTVGGDCAL
jgi:hypothetical protein